MLPLPSIDYFLCALQRSTKERRTAECLRLLYNLMCKFGAHANASLSSKLISISVQLGSMITAQDIYDRVFLPDEASWNIVVTGYLSDGNIESAFMVFQRMQNNFSLHIYRSACLALLKACTDLRDMVHGIKVYLDVRKKNLLGDDVLVGNRFIDMYAKCGSLEKAVEVFENLAVRDVVLWTTLMEAFMEHGYGDKSLSFLEQMQLEGICPDAVAFICSLKACGITGVLDKIQIIYTELVKKGLDGDVIIGTTLVDMHIKCGEVLSAQKVFDRILIRNIVSWNALMAGYNDNSYGDKTLYCYQQLQEASIIPDNVTYVSVLKACCIIKAIDIGKVIHFEIISKGLEKDIFICNTLIDMYAKCGLLTDAHKVFDNLLDRDQVSWNALLSGYVEHGHGKQALDCFEDMRNEGLSPHIIMFVSSLKACATIGAVKRGHQIHLEVTKKGADQDSLTCNTLIDMYCKFNLLLEAQSLFDMFLIKTLVSWNVLITGYVEHGCSEVALDLFDQMQSTSMMVADAMTVISILKACGVAGAIYKGQDIHIQLVKQGNDRDNTVGNTLVDTYAKCGLLMEAQEVFDRLLDRDIVSWNSLLTGYAQIGECGTVFVILREMFREEKPDFLTFVIVLNACCHAGLLDDGLRFFEAMSDHYGIIAGAEHNSCVINLLSRAGRMDMAVRFIRDMPYHPGMVVWHTMLGACRKWGSVNVGSQVFGHAVQLDENDVATYFCMNNIYADADIHAVAKMAKDSDENIN